MYIWYQKLDNRHVASAMPVNRLEMSDLLRLELAVGSACHEEEDWDLGTDSAVICA